ncbi:hypothetical protein WG66_004315 [Moniliophthora roreri]|nr:hypothetical protein WG66_004315 [Moniliophthora roreri]
MGKGSESSRERTVRSGVALPLLRCELDERRDIAETKCLLKIFAFSSSGKSSRSKDGIIGLPLPEPLPLAAVVVGLGAGRRGDASLGRGVEERAGDEEPGLGVLPMLRGGMLRGGVPEY